MALVPETSRNNLEASETLTPQASGDPSMSVPLTLLYKPALAGLRYQEKPPGWVTSRKRGKRRSARLK